VLADGHLVRGPHSFLGGRPTGWIYYKSIKIIYYKNTLLSEFNQHFSLIGLSKATKRHKMMIFEVFLVLSSFFDTFREIHGFSNIFSVTF
jgi:hypothetical protein